MKKYILFLIVSLLTSIFVYSQSKLQKNVGGHHGEMDFPINWKQYYDYDELVKLQKEIQKKYPDLCTLEHIGKSRMGRDLYVMIITAKKTGKDTEKPAMWVDGAIHGNEVNGSMCSLYLAWYLLTRYDYDSKVYDILNRSTVYVLPALNVDGYDSYVRFPNTENNPREPFRPIDDDGDGLYDEDLTEDIDGDGELSVMYAEDPSGDYRLSKDKMRFIRIENGDWWEGLRFRRIGNEGYDNDKDGLMAEDDLGGIDPNRNFPWDWQKSIGKSYPLSEPETRAVFDFQLKHKNILVDFNFHNTGRLIMYMAPPAAKNPREMRRGSTNEVNDKFAFRSPRQVDPEYQHDMDVLNKSVSDGLYILKTYTPSFGNEYGEHLASTYYMLGAYSYLIELWGSPIPFADSNNDGYISDEEFNKWVELDLGTESWVIPHKVNHADLGEIWIGGTPRKHIGRTPPARYIEQEADKQCRFMLHCLTQLPKLSFVNYSVKKLSDNLYQVEVEVENPNMYPTASDRSLLLKRYTPDVINASVSSNCTIINPVAQTPAERSASGMRSSYIKEATVAGEKVEFRMRGNSKQTFRYTILGNNPSSATLSLSLKSFMGGTDKIEIKLADNK